MRIFVLGLDGATFDCLDPLIDEGILPHLDQLRREGAWGPLATIFPPVTAPAWLALATGLNPGKTGVFDYINKATPDGTRMLSISSLYYKDRALWDYLNLKNLSVGIFNYPTLSPPPQVLGFSVSGIGKYEKEPLTYPPELEQVLGKITGGYILKLNLRSPRYKRNIRLFFDDLDLLMDKQWRALRFLVRERPWDFFFSVFSFTDWMQHILWKDIDPRHPLHDPKASPAVMKKYKETWRKIDGMIGDLLSFIGYGTQFLLVSDHGAGPLDSVFYANTWLAQKGWLKKKQLGWRGFLADKLRLLSEGFDNKYYSAFLQRIKTKLVKIHGTEDLIDTENSLAYSPEHNTMFGCVTLTPRGKAQTGFREKLIRAIKELPATFEGIDHVSVYLPEDIYSGSCINLAPDIFFVLNQYRATCEIAFSRQAFVPAPSLVMRTGGHLPNGVLVARGSAFKKGRYDGLSILDVAPTILALYNVDIPPQMDGKVMARCLLPDVLASINVQASQTDTTTEPKQQLPQDEAGVDETRKMLKSLGYL